MKKNINLFLAHILESIKLIEEYIEGKNRNDFLESKKLQDSVIRRIEIIGEAIQFAGEDRIVWGSDFFGAGGLIRLAVQALREFEMPEELQHKYGFAPLTVEVKRKIFGENLARLLQIAPKRRI